MSALGVSPSAANAEPRLEVSSINKSFPGVHAVRDVSLHIASGEIHALVGENGAGKSTLMQLVAGVLQPDSGLIRLNGRDLADVDERGRMALGIGMVYQERSLVPQLNVAENVFAARQPTGPLGAIRWRRLWRETRELLEQLDADVHPRDLVLNLPPAKQQLIEIAKAMSHGLELLILDEPTAALAAHETKVLFRVMRALADRGVAIIYISHRLAEVFEIADRVTVLRDGAVRGTSNVKETNERELVRLMVGRYLPPARMRSKPSESRTDTVLRVTGLASLPQVKEVDLTVEAGEIVGLAGLVGSGRTELCQALWGARPITGGLVELAGKPYRVNHPAQAMRRGVAMVPEDRKVAGLFLSMTLADNLVGPNLKAISRAGFVSKRLKARFAAEWIERFRIVPPDPARLMQTFSGGNQQKALLAMWFARRPTLLIVDEPTRGVDVGARTDIHEILRSYSATGAGVLVVSSDLPEVLALADRVVVMREGRTTGALSREAATEEAIMRLATLAGESAEHAGAGIKPA